MPNSQNAYPQIIPPETEPLAAVIDFSGSLTIDLEALVLCDLDGGVMDLSRQEKIDLIKLSGYGESFTIQSLTDAILSSSDCSYEEINLQLD